MELTEERIRNLGYRYEETTQDAAKRMSLGLMEKGPLKTLSSMKAMRTLAETDKANSFRTL